MPKIISFKDRKANDSLDQYHLDFEEIQKAVAIPPQSNFHVKEAARTTKGRYVKGGNIEYGLCRSLHAEECVGANASQQLDHHFIDDKVIFDEKLVNLAISMNGIESYSELCGNCRDFIKMNIENGIYVDEMFEIFTQDPEGNVYLAKFRDYLFTPNQMKELSKREKDKLKKLGISDQVFEDEYNTWSNVETHAALLVTKDGETLTGNFFSDCAFHSIEPYRDLALLQHECRIKPDDVSYVAFIARKDFPEISYVERQWLVNTFGMREVPVFQGNLQGDYRKTNTREWLPLAFTPATLITAVPYFAEREKENLARLYK